MEVVSRKLEPQPRQLDNVEALEKAAVVFTSLSNRIRLSVLLRLIEREWSVNELAADLGISQLCPFTAPS